MKKIESYIILILLISNIFTWAFYFQMAPAFRESVSVFNIYIVVLFAVVLFAWALDQVSKEKNI